VSAAELGMKRTQAFKCRMLAVETHQLQYDFLLSLQDFYQEEEAFPETCTGLAKVGTFETIGPHAHNLVFFP